MAEKKVPASDSEDKKDNSKPVTAKKVSRTAEGKDVVGGNVETTVSTTVTSVTTADLKSRFATGSIPLSTDFGNLIDIAECGRRAVGESPDQTDNTLGVGLSLSTDAASVGKLSVKAKSGGGITVDSNGVSIDPTTVLPKGMIMMFSAAANAAIPTGWALCDGNNGTPDLRNRFILGGDMTSIGAKSSASLSGTDNTKKSFSATTDSGNLDLGASTTGTALTLTQIPSHHHDLWDSVNSQIFQADEDANISDDDYGSVISVGAHRDGTPQSITTVAVGGNSSGGTDAHSHGVTFDSGCQEHTHDVDIIAPYYILAFIMKT